MKIFKTLWPLVLLAVLIYVLGHSIGSVPPLGKLFSPFTGFWQNVDGLSEDKELQISGLKDEVKIHFDQNKVPHVFAKNEDDLYFAQGYLMAADRLWQMEFYTLVSSGRLTEAVGPAALEYDKYNRHLGMARTAQQIEERLDQFPEVKKTLMAYSAGVNAYISQLAEKDLPVEYKILNYKPETWSPLKTYLMLMNMRNQLNGGSTDYKMSNIAQKYGLEVVNDLFPDQAYRESPVIPVGTAWGFGSLPLPATPANKAIFADDASVAMNLAEPNPNIGSNNWAVHGSKSATGLPILANDPHLGLSFPSIWYQMQLSAPGLNVYGSCLPGVPGVIIGFNKDIAWGVTNTGPDVMDFYKIKFKDQQKDQYFHDTQWKKTEKVIETYRMKDGTSVQDTVIYTHHGPVLYEHASEKNFKKDVPIGFAMKWIGHEDGPGDLLCFMGLNRAKNYDDYRKAIANYIAPAQNFIFASNQNDVSITPSGKLPLKWPEQGKFLLDGTDAAYDWQGFIPAEQNPTVKNPPRGFVSSANQASTDASYPYYIDWTFAEPYRASRINERLTRMQNATADSLRNIQNDNYNKAAEWFLPLLLKATEKEQGPAIQALRTWHLKNDADSKAASIFEGWLEELMVQIWDDEFPVAENMRYPAETRTLLLMEQNPDSKWFDNVKTKNKAESMQDIIEMSYKATIDSLTKKYGAFGPAWEWANVKGTGIRHLVPAFEGFSTLNIKTGGGRRIVNATANNWGPSWRMVVELDSLWPKAYGIYPGGQSGNPASKYYQNMVEKWAAGELIPLLFMKSEAEKTDQIMFSQTLKPSK